jgi:UDP-N-acetylmuramyl tripeptide synthase
MKHQLITLVGKGIRKAATIKGGGSALPGLVIERIDPSFLKKTLTQLPNGVVLVSGTNGKTTTTKMVVELLESQGLKVFTNRTGSNFTRGIIAAVLESADKSGKLPHDIAVLELDEAYAVRFVKQIQPRYSLLLNVFRDQLDRFGEIDSTAKMLKVVAEYTEGMVVINRNDPRLSSASFLKGITATVTTYGLSQQLESAFPSDDDMRNAVPTAISTPTFKNDDTQLDKFESNTATISYAGSSKDIKLKLKGIYNIQNATAAVAIVRAIMNDKLNENLMLEALSNVQPAFGRGEDITVKGQPVELVLVKNPSGFRLSLASFDPNNTATMIAINDNYADGRDMSWLWDVNFESLSEQGVASITGVRAYDMTLRLQYDEVEVGMVNTNIKASLAHFIATPSVTKKRIYCTYTAMLAIRKELAKIAEVEKIL